MTVTDSPPRCKDKHFFETTFNVSCKLTLFIKSGIKAIPNLNAKVMKFCGKPTKTTKKYG